MNSEKENRVNLKEISGALNSPEAFTAKTLQLLVKAEIIESQKGAAGGFVLNAANSENLNLGTLVSAIDGNRISTGCGLGLAQCSETEPCPVHDQFVLVREQIEYMLENTPIAGLTENLNLGLTHIKRNNSHLNT